MSEEIKKATEKLDLASIKDTLNWESLAELHKETLDDINKQIALVIELQSQHKDTLTEEMDQAFSGLLLSFKDLILETISIGVEHAVSTQTTDNHGTELEYATDFKRGKIEDDDVALDYINVASKYISVQDKTVNLIALGWVDLFTKLKMSTKELDKVIEDIKKENDTKE